MDRVGGYCELDDVGTLMERAEEEEEDGAG